MSNKNTVFGEKKPSEHDTAYAEWQKHKTPENMSKVITTVQPIIDSALHTYGYSENPVALNEARLHVAKVLPRYDASKASLNTFIFNELQRMQRTIPAMTSPIKIPEGASMDLRHIRSVESELEANLGRPPNLDELSDATKLSKRRISVIKERYGNPELQESAFMTETGAKNLVAEADENEELWMDAVYNSLDDVDKRILDWSTGRGGQEIIPKSEMARRLKMSPPAVTQRAMRIANKLQEGQNYIL